MSFKRLFALGAVVVGLGLVGCAKAPEQEIASSRAALESARSAAAETWAGSEWQEAQDAMSAVDVELETQAAKMGLFRSYSHANELLVTAQAKAQAAQQAAEANKEKARSQAHDALEAARAALASAQSYSDQLTQCPKKPKGFDADMAVMTGNLEALQAELTAAQSLYDSESYQGATDDAGSLTGQFETLSADMQSVMEKIGCQSVPPGSEG